MSRERVLILTLACVQFTHVMDFMIIMPLGPQLMRLLQIDPQQFGAIVSAYTISAGVSGFFAAFFIDNFDRKRSLIICYLCFLLGTLACGLAPGFGWLLSARIITGAFGGVLGTLVLSIVGDSVPLGKRSAAMGIIMAAFSAASVFGVPAGLFLSDIYDWHAPFFFLLAIGSTVWFMVFLFVPSIKMHMSTARSPGLSALSYLPGNRNALLALLFMILVILGQFSVIPYIAAYMVSNVGFAEGELAYIYLLGGAATILTSPLLGRLSDRQGNARMYTLLALISIAPLYWITHLEGAGMTLALTVNTLLFIFISGRMIPSMTIITSAIKPQNRGSFMSINTSVRMLAAGLSSYVAGVIVVQDASGRLLNYEWVGYLAIATTLLSIIIGQKIKSAY